MIRSSSRVISLRLGFWRNFLSVSSSYSRFKAYQRYSVEKLVDLYTVFALELISLRLGFRRKFQSVSSCQNIHRNATGDQINFQNTFDRPWSEIMMKIQTENFFRILISTRLLLNSDGYFGMMIQTEIFFGILILMRLVQEQRLCTSQPTFLPSDLFQLSNTMSMKIKWRCWSNTMNIITFSSKYNWFLPWMI
jgi:hypothetical protein